MRIYWEGKNYRVVESKTINAIIQQKCGRTWMLYKGLNDPKVAVKAAKQLDK